MPKYFVFDFLDWVHILPVTSDGNLVMLRQYRHGAQESFLEVPGGALDLNEGALVGAQRELVEETGYTSLDWHELPSHFPNPAIQSNRMRTFVAMDCQKTHEPMLDPFEDLRVEVMALRDVYAQLDRGEITHSLMAASLAMARGYLIRRLPGLG